MSQITRDALLLGMKHHGFMFPADALVPSEAIALRRDPHNQHDPNAIAVHISGVMAGFIDKQNAQIIAPLLDKGAKASVGAIANIDMAEWLYRGASVWWVAGAAGAVMSAFWNYAMSTLFVWRAR